MTNIYSQLVINISTVLVS